MENDKDKVRDTEFDINRKMRKGEFKLVYLCDHCPC